ncbi:hypothetical protein EON81_06910 [bacterium]|nr:MAG: hypothetical protein EON81_06910 [bacterium]
MSRVLVLYLDIYGVLNAHKILPNGYCTIEPEYRDRLNRILHELPDVRIVLSSAWRYLVHGGSMTVRGLSNLMMSHGVDLYCADEGMTKSRLVAVTDSDEFTRREFGDGIDSLQLRVEQILADVRREGIGRWLAVDDLALPLPSDRFVRTCGETGLTDADVDEIIRRFKAMPEDAEDAEDE